MADMSSLDFAMMVEDTHIDTVLTEYRARQRDRRSAGLGPLLAVCLTDRLADGLSLVYSFYDPDVARRSLGSFVILDHIEKARRLGLPHVYLGYWVEGSKKMGYKAGLPAAGAPRPARLGAGGAVGRCAGGCCAVIGRSEATKQSILADGPGCDRSDLREGAWPRAACASSATADKGRVLASPCKTSARRDSQDQSSLSRPTKHREASDELCICACR